MESGIYQELGELFPLDSQQKIYIAMGAIRRRNARVNDELEVFLFDNTPERLHAFLKGRLDNYKKGLEPRRMLSTKTLAAKKKKDKESHSDPLRRQMFSLRKDNGFESPSNKGYEHGLSDW